MDNINEIKILVFCFSFIISLSTQANSYSLLNISTSEEMDNAAEEVGDTAKKIGNVAEEVGDTANETLQQYQAVGKNLNEIVSKNYSMLATLQKIVVAVLVWLWLFFGFIGAFIGIKKNLLWEGFFLGILFFGPIGWTIVLSMSDKVRKEC